METTEEELWLPIEGYERLYEVSNMGHVKSLHGKGRILKPGYIRGKYQMVILCKDGVTKPFKVHRLVASAFIPNPENKREVNHKYGIKTDNRASQLEWSTSVENIEHAVTTGITAKVFGTRNGRSQKVINLSTGKIYDTVQEASDDNRLKRQCLTNYLSGRRKNITTLSYYNG